MVPYVSWPYLKKCSIWSCWSGWEYRIFISEVEAFFFFFNCLAQSEFYAICLHLVGAFVKIKRMFYCFLLKIINMSWLVFFVWVVGRWECWWECMKYYTVAKATDSGTRLPGLKMLGLPFNICGLFTHTMPQVSYGLR